jgi:hypothetical protein
MYLLPAAVLAFVGVGCNGGSLSINYYDDEPVKPVYVHKTHVYTDAHHHRYYCGDRVIVVEKNDPYGRYWNGHRWVVVRTPPPRPGYSHMWNGKHWVSVRKAPPKTVVYAKPYKAKAKPYKPHPKPPRKKVKHVYP